jgi:hypothetical protein
MRTATFLIMSALGMACAHRNANQPTIEAAQTSPPRESKATELDTRSQALSNGSGDPRLGTLEIASTPAAPRAELAEEAGEKAEQTKAPPRAIEPAAPTVATAPPGSALTPKAPDAASKEEANLRERIQSTLMHDQSLSFTAKRIRVEIERGRVTLLGEVRTLREKNEVAELVHRVEGVRRVTNRLAVIDQPAATRAP